MILFPIFIFIFIFIIKVELFQKTQRGLLKRIKVSKTSTSDHRNWNDVLKKVDDDKRE